MEKKLAHWNTFQQIALRGTAIFLERLVPIEKLESEYLKFNKTNARNFLLLKLLTEVQKAGFVFRRWDEFLKNEGSIKPQNVKDQILETFIDEQSLWQRKLQESLVLLINFSSTNELIYYHHLLLLKELADYRSMKSEQEKFFTRGSALTEKTISLLTEKIRIIKDEIDDITQCWYLSGQKTGVKKERLSIISFSKQLIKALSRATPSEKTAMAYTYGKSYGETSGNIHLNITRMDDTNLYNRFSFGFSQCGLLAVSILQRAHDLVGLKPEGINEQLLASNRDLRSNNPLIKELAKGDFVLANGPYLAEILDIDVSKFGYETYLVKFLQEMPLEGVEEDWLPSFEIQPYVKRSDLVRGISDELQAVAQEEGMPILKVSTEEIQEAIYHSVIDMWRLGLGKYFKRTMVPFKKGYKGMGYNPLDDVC